MTAPARTSPERGSVVRGALVVVNYGSAALLRDNLGSLQALEGVAVIVVDNFCSDEERREVGRLAQERAWDLVLSPNDGFGAGVNLGVARAARRGFETVVVLNPDVRAEGQVLVELLASAARRPQALVVPQSFRPNGVLASSCGSLDLSRGLTRTSPARPAYAERWLSGACFAVSLDLWHRLGGFDEDYFMYWEDVDLSYRAERAGAALVCRDDLRVIHDGGGTQGRGKSALYFFYNCRNRLLFARKHLGPRAQLVWAGHCARYGWNVATRDGRRRPLRQPGQTVVPALAGSLVGLRRLLELRG